MTTVHVQMEMADVHAVLLALAVLSLQRPGWHHYLAGIARVSFAGADMFQDFRRLNADVVKPL